MLFRIDNTKFPIIRLGDSHSVKTGDEIFVASNPKGLEGSFTKGIVSSVRETETGKTAYGEVDAYIKNTIGKTDRTLFQIDAAISSGSSGGVVVNTKGEAIGIVKSSVISGQNLNFAIPIEQLTTLWLKFRHPIQLAGACAYRDRDKEKLNGLVKSVTEKARYQSVENGRLIETEPVTTGINVFDPDGNKIESHFYSVEGEFFLKFIMMFDESRLVISSNEVSPNGRSNKVEMSFEQSIKAKLNTRRFSSEFVTNEKGDTQFFDSHGNMVVWNIGGTKQVYEYDNEGREKEKVQWRNGRIEIRTRYRYKDDKFGNWIEKYEYSNFPTSANKNVSPNDWIEGNTEYREITYYD